MKKAITGKELLERGKAAPGKLVAGDVLDVIYMDDDAMRGAAAEAPLMSHAPRKRS